MDPPQFDPLFHSVIQDRNPPSFFHIIQQSGKEKSDPLRFPFFLAHQPPLMPPGPWGGFRALLWLKVGPSKFGSIFDHIIQQSGKEKSDRLRFPLFLAHQPPLMPPGFWGSFRALWWLKV